MVLAVSSNYAHKRLHTTTVRIARANGALTHAEPHGLRAERARQDVGCGASVASERRSRSRQDGSLPRRAYLESLRAAEAKNHRSRSCIMENIALGAWSRANKALGCASCFIGSRPRSRAIFPRNALARYFN